MEKIAEFLKDNNAIVHYEEKPLINLDRVRMTKKNKIREYRDGIRSLDCTGRTCIEGDFVAGNVAIIEKVKDEAA